MNPILKDLSLEVLIIREDSRSGKDFLKILHTLTQLNNVPDSEFEIRTLLSQAWKHLMDEIKLQRKKLPPLYAHDRSKDMLSYIHKHYHEKFQSLTLPHMQVSVKKNASVLSKICFTRHQWIT